MYSTVFFPGGFYKALHSFSKHFTSLQLLIEWNKFCLANYLNRCEFILHISHRFSWIFLHSVNYSWSTIDGWPKQLHVIVNNMYWQPNTFPETTKNIFDEGVNLNTVHFSIGMLSIAFQFSSVKMKAMFSFYPKYIVKRNVRNWSYYICLFKLRIWFQS